MVSDYENLIPIIENNKKLVEKYPWLYPRDWYGNKIKDEDYDYSYTALDDMPKGWRETFGIQMMEEIKPILSKANYENEYTVIQIKEKFGSLCWYDNGAPESIYNELNKVILKYESLSEITCINCGKPAKWRSLGWICPYCDDCIDSNRKYTPIY